MLYEQWPSKSAEWSPSGHQVADEHAERSPSEFFFAHRAPTERLPSKTFFLHSSWGWFHETKCRSVAARWSLGGCSVSAQQTCSATVRRVFLGISGVREIMQISFMQISSLLGDMLNNFMVKIYGRIQSDPFYATSGTISVT